MRAKDFGPGLLLAAAGVGAGDLATAAFAGAAGGLTMLWFLALGIGLKFALSYELARRQLLSGKTWFEENEGNWGKSFYYFFLIYLLFWSVSAFGALINASANVLALLLAIPGDDSDIRFLLGLVQCCVAILLIAYGGYDRVARINRLLVALMFISVVSATTWAMKEGRLSLVGLSSSPSFSELPTWGLALVGGVGGTVTLLNYGYWMKQEERRSPIHLAACGWDLLLAYLTTASFSVCFLFLGASTTPGQFSKGDFFASLASTLAPQEPGIRLLFLLGCWVVVFSCLLSSWQGFPFLLANFQKRSHVSRIDHCFLGVLVSLALLGTRFPTAVTQKWFSLVGSFFIVFLGITLVFPSLSHIFFRPAMVNKN